MSESGVGLELHDLALKRCARGSRRARRYARPDSRRCVLWHVAGSLVCPVSAMRVAANRESRFWSRKYPPSIDNNRAGHAYATGRSMDLAIVRVGT
jgi:hypothetical protein